MSGETKQRLSDLESENAALRKQLEDRPTLRDQFAMAAMTGIITRTATYFDSQSFNLFTDYSYQIADAMMEQRKDG